MENCISAIQKGTIIFQWESNKEVTVACVVEDEQKVSHDLITTSGMGKLKSVEVNYGNDEANPLCLECQTHLIKPRMVECPEGSGCLEEVEQCLNPDCPSQV